MKKVNIKVIIVLVSFITTNFKRKWLKVQLKKKLKTPKISETLLIPLAARANEMNRKDAVIQDKRAVEFLNKVDTSKLIVDGGSISTLGILARTMVIDDEVKKLLNSCLNAVVINLGVGLDTRYDRIGSQKIIWYDIDLPEVIALRKEFVENKSIHFISKSVLDDSWTKDIRVNEHDKVIIIAEGLLMYFKEDEVRKILNIISTAFPNAHIFFDVLHTFFINKKISSEFLWGIDNAKDIENLNENIKLVQSWSMGNLLKKRQQVLLRIFNILPSTRNRSQILHLIVNEHN